MKLYYQVILFCFFISNLTGQENIYEIEHLNIEDGLSNRHCRQIIEDDFGDIWIATSDGLNIYDGYNFKVFDNNNSSILKDYIHNIIKDQHGNIWVIQILSSGRRRGDKNKFTEIKYHVSIVKPISNVVLGLDEYILDQSSLKSSNLREITKAGTSIILRFSNDDIYIFDKELKLYLKSYNQGKFLGLAGKNKFYSQIGNQIEIKSKSLETTDSIDISNLNYYKILPKSDFELILLPKTTDVKEFRIISEKEIRKHKPLANSKLDFIHLHLNEFDIDEPGQVQNYFRLYNQVFLDGNNKSICQLVPIDQCKIHSSLLSKSGLLYLGTSDGLLIISINKKLFNALFSHEKQVFGFRGILKTDSFFMANNYISEIAEFKNPKRGFVFPVNSKPVGLAHYRDPLNPNVIWTTYHNNRIRKVNIKKGEIEWFKIENYYGSGSCCILRTKSSNQLYIGNESGLQKLDESTDSVIPVNLNNNTESNIEIHHIQEKDSKLWLATNKGIVVYDEIDSSSTFFNTSNSELIYDNINFIHFDNKDSRIIWLATKGKGLHRWDLKVNTLEVFNKNSGLSNNDIHCIYQDSNMNLWLPSNKNLNWFNTLNNKNTIFTTANGTSDEEFNLFSHFEDNNGYYYFGGRYGITVFHPDSIKNLEKPNIKIRPIEASIYMKEGVTQDILRQFQSQKKLEVNENIISIELKFSTNHVFKSNDKSYQYKIPGLEEKWVDMNDNSLRISHLPYGIFTILIRINPNLSDLRSDIFELQLNVVKPFYKKILFKILVGLVLGGLIYGLILYRLRLSRQRNINLEKIVKERTKELEASNQTKSKLFAIIGHDLRNPIASLNNIVQKINYLIDKKRESEINELTADIDKKIKSLDQNLNNMLNWALAEQQTIPYKPKNLFIRPIILSICHLYFELIKSKDLEILNQLSHHDQIFADETAVQSIFRNVIHNAIKFSSHNGKIIFRYNLVNSESSCIEVENEFENLETNGNGLGIGLKIVSELVTLNNGKFELIKTDNRIALVKLLFPFSES